MVGTYVMLRNQVLVLFTVVLGKSSPFPKYMEMHIVKKLHMGFKNIFVPK